MQFESQTLYVATVVEHCVSLSLCHWNLQQISAIQLPIQFPANVPSKMTEDCPCTWSSAKCMRDQDGVPGYWLPQTWLLGPFENWNKGCKICWSAFQINSDIKVFKYPVSVGWVKEVWKKYGTFWRWCAYWRDDWIWIEGKVVPVGVQGASIWWSYLAKTTNELFFKAISFIPGQQKQELPTWFSLSE